MPKRKRFAASKLLNRPGYHSTAAVAAFINPERYYYGGEIHISDCDRKISLEFSAADVADIKNGLYKIDALMGVLQKFRDAFEEGAYAYLEEKKKK